jgi:hypothetical protein
VIDFRYHLVSIVSIFLALAVGIVLGAGPLQGELGDTLTNEVAGLREDKAQLNAQLSDATAEIDAREDYIGETNPAILADSLDGQRVAVVVLPGTDTALVESTATSLASSGAAVVSTTTIAQNWVSTDEAVVTARDAAVRDAAAGAGIDVSDTGSVSARDVLLAALLSTSARTLPNTIDAQQARAALATLASADLIDVAGEDVQIADLVVVVAETITEGNPAAQQAAADRWVDLVIALDARSAGLVTAGATTTATDAIDVVASIRNDATATEGVSTVDNGGSTLGQASIVHALVEQRAGEVGQYGFAEGADAPFAPVPAP